MTARHIVLAATLALAAVACGASPTPAPVAPAPVAPAPVAPAPVAPAEPPAPASSCSKVWNGREAMPADFVACKTTDDCTTAPGGVCCPGPVAVNKTHAACVHVETLPCDVMCPPKKPVEAQCVRNTCTLVPK